jgi:hypothetical protein
MDQFVFFKLIAQIIQLKVHVTLVVQLKFVPGLVLQLAQKESVWQ